MLNLVPTVLDCHVIITLVPTVLDCHVIINFVPTVLDCHVIINLVTSVWDGHWQHVIPCSYWLQCLKVMWWSCDTYCCTWWLQFELVRSTISLNLLAAYSTYWDLNLLSLALFVQESHSYRYNIRYREPTAATTFHPVTFSTCI